MAKAKFGYHSTYYGCDIYHNRKGYYMGLNWESFTPRGNVRADTLEGVKRLIRDAVKKGPRRY